jgi:hypothetical protein
LENETFSTATIVTTGIPSGKTNTINVEKKPMF